MLLCEYLTIAPTGGHSWSGYGCLQREVGGSRAHGRICDIINLCHVQVPRPPCPGQPRIHRDLPLHKWSWGRSCGAARLADSNLLQRILDNQLSTLMWIDERANEFSDQIQKVADRGAAAERGSKGSKLRPTLL